MVKTSPDSAPSPRIETGTCAASFGYPYRCTGIDGAKSSWINPSGHPCQLPIQTVKAAIQQGTIQLLTLPEFEELCRKGPIAVETH